MGLAMPEQGLCMYQMDLEGHGYSGGERAYIENYNHWVDDYRQVCALVYFVYIGCNQREERKNGEMASFVCGLFPTGIGTADRSIPCTPSPFGSFTCRVNG